MLEFTLNELISVASEAGWLPSNVISVGRRKVSIVQLSHEIRLIRNFVHPGVWARRRSKPTNIRKKKYKEVFTICQVAVAWLQFRVYQTGMKEMKRAGIYDQVKHIPWQAWFV